MKTIIIKSSEVKSVRQINKTEVEVFFKDGGSCILTRVYGSKFYNADFDEFWFEPLMY